MQLQRQCIQADALKGHHYWGTCAPRVLGTRTPARLTCHAQQVDDASNADGSSSDASSIPNRLDDPEARFRRYGRWFGGGYRFHEDWLDDVPRVRVRQSAQRAQDELVELAVLNERLAGSLQPWEARSKLEYLRMRRRNWERIYDYVTSKDAAATLSVIEEANRKVEEVLSEEARERASVSTLRQQLVDLQQQVDEAHQRLHRTQARVEQNLSRVNELKAEAVALERMQRATQSAATLDAASLERSLAAALPISAPVATLPASPPSTSAPAAPATPRPRRDRGLRSTVETEPALRNFWYPAVFSKDLTPDKLIPFDMFGEPWVLFRNEHGAAACVRDECAHRACPLSLGRVVEGHIECPYHGWQYDAQGACTKMPSTRYCGGIAVSALPCEERDGFVWVWPGEGDAPQEVPSFTRPPPGYEIHAEIMIDVPVEHGLLMENLLDLAHAPFTHTTTFARGWPVPDFVKFHAQEMLSGAWDPYPISMEFVPPCGVLSTIGLAQPGKIQRRARAEACERHLHQLHVCLPGKPGTTRLLYRMSLDFLPWAKRLPLIGQLWKTVADQVMGEDLVLVAGQQDRMTRGGDTWRNPVSYDKLAVRYRRWRNAVVDSGSSGGAGAQEYVTGTLSMSSGELFALEEEWVKNRASEQQ